MDRNEVNGISNGFEMVKEYYYVNGRWLDYVMVAVWDGEVGSPYKMTIIPVDATNWAANTTHIIVATIDADNNQRIFLDGVEGFEATEVSGGSYARETALGTSMYFGIHDDGTYPIGGPILGAVYDGLLTDSEIASISAMTNWRDLSRPVPTLTSVTPSSTTVGSPDMPVTLVGSDFVPSSVVQWKGTPLVTDCVNATHLRATIPAADLKTTGTFAVTVLNEVPGG